MVKRQFKQYNSFVIPAYRLPGTDCGRGRGGLVQMSDKSFDIGKKRMSCKSPRIQAQVLNFPSGRLLWINCYMPCDPQKANHDYSELILTLSEIENLVTSNPDCKTIFCGDMNLEVTRNNEFVRIFSSMMRKLNLTSAWEIFPPDFTHIHTDGIN